MDTLASSLSTPWSTSISRERAGTPDEDIVIESDAKALLFGRVFVSTPTRIDEGEPTSLAAEVADPDGDPMTFSWRSACPGSFSLPESEDTVFTLGSREGDSCTLSLTVSDGREGEITGTITLETGPAVAPELPE